MKWIVEWYASKGKSNKFNKARGDPREFNNKQDENGVWAVSNPF
jgi:hypothetical protein